MTEGHRSSAGRGPRATLARGNPRGVRTAVAVLTVAGLAGCGDPAPHARAQRIGAPDEAIGGPHAIGRIGDFLLENDQIRLVIADTGVDPAAPSRST